jgi:hypothetical protein
VMLTGCGAGSTGTENHTATTSSAKAFGYAIPGCYPPNKTGADQNRPTQVVLQGCMSNGLWLEGMTWSTWGPDGADGTGTIAANTCEVNCASGPVVKNPVVVHAQNPQPAPQRSHCPADVQFYSQVVLAFPNGSPPAQYVTTNTRYRDMTASAITPQSAPATLNDWGFPQCS